MGTVLVTCPATGREYAAGIQMSEETFIALPDVPSHARCPYCQIEHEWHPRAARLVVAIPPSDWIENQK